MRIKAKQIRVHSGLAQLHVNKENKEPKASIVKLLFFFLHINIHIENFWGLRLWRALGGGLDLNPKPARSALN